MTGEESGNTMATATTGNHVRHDVAIKALDMVSFSFSVFVIIASNLSTVKQVRFLTDGGGGNRIDAELQFQ